MRTYFEAHGVHSRDARLVITGTRSRVVESVCWQFSEIISLVIFPPYVQKWSSELSLRTTGCSDRRNSDTAFHDDPSGLAQLFELFPNHVEVRSEYPSRLCSES